MFALPAELIREISRHWMGRLSAYRLHGHDEHREALFLEAMRYCGLKLESDLSLSAYWREADLLRRAAVLLFLVDRGVVSRRLQEGRYVYEPLPHAEAWVASQPSLLAYRKPTFELLSALRRVSGPSNETARA
jgi:hypothetical protein